MNPTLLAETVLVLAMIVLGARKGGIALGLWGGVGLLGMAVLFGVAPTSPPVDVMLIILAVVMAASVMDAAGGIEFLVRIAERIIRRNPKQVTLVAPLVVWVFTFLSGTGHIVYPLLPVIYEVAHQNGVRPERPMSVSTIASIIAIPASPVAAATAAMIALLHEHAGSAWSLGQMLAISIPASLFGIVAAAFVSMFIGKELADDPEYQARLKAGLIPAPKAQDAKKELPAGARLTAFIFLAGVVLIVLVGLFPELRTMRGAKSPIGMPVTIQVVMLAAAAFMVLFAKVEAAAVISTATCRSGIIALVSIFGLAWLGDTYISANKAAMIASIGSIAKAAPWTFAVGLFFGSVLLGSQAAATRAIMPLGFALGIAPASLVGMLSGVCGPFFLPTSGLLLAAVNNDLSGTTKIRKWVFNHSFMIPGLVATIAGVAGGLALAAMR